MISHNLGKYLPYRSLKVYVKNGPSSASFFFIFAFSNKHYNCAINKCEKMTIQYAVLGFELKPS